MAEQEVCSFYLQGRCRYGDNCRFYHPPGCEGQGKSGFSRNNNNNNYDLSAFGSEGGGGGGNKGGWDGGGGFGGTGNGYNRDGGNRGGGRSYKPRNHERSSQDDQGDKPPLWPLTAIAKKDPSAGNIVDDEYSPDELRVQAYMMAPRGQSAEVNAREMQLVEEHKNKKLAALGKLPIAASDPFASNGNGGGGGGGEHTMRDLQSDDPFSSAPNGGGTFGRSARNVAMSFGGDPFGGQPSNAASGAPSTAFGSASNASPFGGGGGGPSPFGGAVSAAAAVPSAAPARFGGNGNENLVPPVPGVKQESSLAEHEVKAFNAQSFGFDPIPETAPPARFC